MKLSPKDRRDYNRILFKPILLTILAALFLFGCFFLPLLSSTGEYRERWLSEPEGHQAAGEVLTNKEAVDVSMKEFFQIYWSIYSDNSKEEAITSIVLFCGSTILAVFMILFALLKLPVFIIIFDIFATLLHCTATYYISTKEQMFIAYKWGFGNGAYFLALVLVFIAARHLRCEKKDLFSEFDVDDLLEQEYQQ